MSYIWVWMSMLGSFIIYVAVGCRVFRTRNRVNELGCRRFTQEFFDPKVVCLAF